MRSSDERRPALADRAQVLHLFFGAVLLATATVADEAGHAMRWNDGASGALVAVLGALSVSPRRSWARWANGLVGLWLLLAPLVFWAPTAAAYAIDTLVGAAVATLACIVPHVREGPGTGRPPGWTYNPSEWSQRIPVVVLALAGFLAARPLSSYQLGHVENVWEPFFGEGTRRILTSNVSRAFPVSDAGLGAVSYLVEALSGCVGGRNRWRTMPWTVVLFGLLVVPSGATSIVLVVLQPVAVGGWCTLCLAAASIMLAMTPPALDEIVATGHLLANERRKGRSIWRILWSGTEEDRAARSRIAAAPGPDRAVVPRTLVGSAVLAVWLMASPAVLGLRGPAATNAYVVSACAVTIAVLALAEVSRSVRLLNVLFGAWLAIAPWMLEGATPASRLSDGATGIAWILLSLPRGALLHRYGTWDRWIV
jgi:hypothetical protein